MGLHYGDQRGEGREESWKRESGGSNRPVIILRNVCELCGQSFDNQFVFYKHLREHYEPEFISIGYPTDIPEPEGDSEYAKEDDNDGFVNDNEQFEEIFANNINKSPDMIEHLEIFIKNQESRTETIDGMMMIEDPQSSAPQNLEFVNIEQMRNVQEPQLNACANVVAQMAEDTSRLYPNHHQQPLQEPIPIATEEGIVPEEEEHFADISSLPSCSPPPQQPEEEEIEQDDHREIHAAIPTPPDPDPEPINLATRELPKKSKTRKNKGYPCKQCDRKFESSSALKYHETAHAMRKFQCEYCDKMFLTKSTLSIHLRIHLEKRPYNCAHCDLQFRQKTDLNYHTASKHTAVDDYRFKCDYCDKKFARKYSLNLHTKLHTGEKNHQCEVCNKSFRASSYLQVHLRTHTGEKPYECSLCKKRFSVRADVRRHIGQVHRKTAKRSRSSVGSNTAATGGEEPSQKRKKGN